MSTDYLKVKGRLEGFTYFKGKLADVLQEGWEQTNFGVDDFNSNKNNRLEKAMLKKVCQQKE